MGRLLVDLPLWVIRADVAEIAGFRLAGLVQAEFMPQVALGAVTGGTVQVGFADVMAGFTREAGDLRPFQRE